MDRHPTEYASALLARLRGISAEVYQAVCQHHEFVDGSGYPRRLSGDRISMPARILSVANQLSLLLAKGLRPPDVGAHLSGEASRYDPSALSATLEILRRYAE